jgi:Holliday junction resolvasome RuvABC endonuclease subunit
MNNIKQLNCIDSMFCQDDVNLMVDKNIKYAVLGIDPSINSTGLTLLYVDKGKVTACCNIITPYIYDDVNCNVIQYNKVDKAKAEVSVKEHNKMLNFLSISNKIVTLILSIQQHNDFDIKAFAIEGISMNAQFNRSSSNIYDLSALNYAIRAAIANNFDLNAIYIPPRSLKLKTTGDGKASKQAMYEKFCADTMQEVYFKNVQKDKPHLADLADSFAAAKEAMYSYFISNYK